jgi:hypothetical protein
VLASKVSQERRALQSRLTSLESVGWGRFGGPPRWRQHGAGADRSLKPRWLIAALKLRLEDFTVARLAKKQPALRMRTPGE